MTTTQRSKLRPSYRGGALAVCCLLGGSLSVAAAPSEPGIYFQVAKLKSDEGSLRCGLFADEDSWLDPTPHATAQAKIHKGRATCVFRDVKPGVYGLTALHDEDGNGAMTKSALGLPEEGYAASRRAVREGVAAPDWDDAKFRYEGGVRRLKAVISYP